MSVARLSARRKIVLATAAVVACAAAAFVLGLQLNRTRLTLQHDGVPEFDLVQRLDHDFDALAHALADRSAFDAYAPGPAPGSDADREAERGRLDAAWLARFDALHDALVRAGSGRAGSLRDDPRSAATLERVRAWLARARVRLDAGAGDDSVWRARTRTEALALSGEVHGIGLAIHRNRSRVRDDIARRMTRLTHALTFFGASFLAAGLTLYVLLARSTRRSSRLFGEATQAQDQLEAALAELTDGDLARKSQNRFLASATHDLRQPLQALQYYLAALHPHIATERGHEIVARIVRSTDAAQRLLTELLDISKLDAGVLEARRAPTDLDEVLEHLHDSVRPEAEARGLALTVARPGVWVDTDGSLLERILRNLLSNALAYTREGGVTLGAAPTPDGTAVVLSVVDTGIGIPRTERESIFDEYYRLDAPGRDPDRGIGLGLAIVRRLARLLDIPIGVDSEVGSGTRFELTLPRVAPAVRFADAPCADAGTRTGAAGLAGLVVLVIDDEPDVRDGVATLLRQHGCEVLAASSEDEALALLVDAGVVPDLVVADYRLQHGRTGVEAIERVREEVNEEVPALVVTGDTSPDRLREAAASGLPLLHKPVDAARLFAAMTETTGVTA